MKIRRNGARMIKNEKVCELLFPSRAIRCQHGVCCPCVHSQRASVVVLFLTIHLDIFIERLANVVSGALLDMWQGDWTPLGGVLPGGQQIEGDQRILGTWVNLHHR